MSNDYVRINPPYLDAWTLRDYFAAKAMQGMLANTSGKTFDSRVKRAWEIADAMLAAREQSSVKP